MHRSARLLPRISTVDRPSSTYRGVFVHNEHSSRDGTPALPSTSLPVTRRVLVTGGAGFVGSHVVDALSAVGDEVVIVDDLSTGSRANLPPRIDLRVVDVADGPALGRAVEGEHFDAVVHCAAKTKVVQSMEQPELYRRGHLRRDPAVRGRGRPPRPALAVRAAQGGGRAGRAARGPSCGDAAARARIRPPAARPPPGRGPRPPS